MSANKRAPFLKPFLKKNATEIKWWDVLAKSKPKRLFFVEMDESLVRKIEETNAEKVDLLLVGHTHRKERK